MNNSVVEVYSDGSCLNNPGPGGFAYIVRFATDVNGETKYSEIEFSEAYKLTTNNRMEIMGAMRGVMHVINEINSGNITGCTGINVVTDSKYTCDAISQRWIQKWQMNNWVTSTKTSVKNRDLWELFIDTLNKLASMNIPITMNHIPGHAGHEYNERCDKAALAAAKGTNHIQDAEYEKTFNMNRRG